MKIAKKISKYKITDKFIKTALAGMLIFTTLIPSAVSYQQAMTTTSENTYSIGEGVSATLNIQSSQQNVVYPGEYIPMKPIISNTGSVPIWIILAVKIPSMNNPYRPGLMAFDPFYPFVNEDQSAYYPAFYTIPHSSYTGKVDLLYYDNSNHGGFEIDEEKEAQGKDKICLDASGEQRTNDGWSLLNIVKEDGTSTKLPVVNTDYAVQENGYYIYYYGYQTVLRANSQPEETPFDGILPANFQEVGLSVLSDKQEVNLYDCNEFKQNINVEMRLFAIQGSEFSSVDDAWAKNKAKLSVFGNTSIVNVTTESEYTAGRHELVFDVTKDVQQIKFTNTTSGKSETFTLTNGTNVKVEDVDKNGIKKVTLNVNFDSTGTYEASVCADDTSTFINAVTVGYVKIK